MKDDQMVRAAQAREEEGVLNEAQDSVKAEIDGVALDAAPGCFWMTGGRVMVS